MTTTTVFGEVSYSDDFGGESKKNNNNKDLWLRLSDGDNEVRIVTAPFQYVTHKYKKEGDPGFGQKVGCTAIYNSCQLCEMPDNKAKQRWFYGVIDRKTGTYKVLDVSFAIFSKIRDLARSPKWGDPTKYDINILVKKGAPPNDYYNVQPLPKEPLSAADQQIKDNADLEDLKRRCTPLTIEQQQRRLDKINGVVSADASVKTGGKVSSKPVAKVAAKIPAVDMVDDGSLTDDFPSFDGDAQQS
jgi:hypothetical protein